MIVNDNLDYNKMVAQNDGLPTYDMATGQLDRPYTYDTSTQGRDVKVPPPTFEQYDNPPFPAPQLAGPSSPAAPSVPRMPPTTVYNYVNPQTGEHVASLLPPGHPAMICLQQGQHVRETKYGLLGVLAAVFWFPLGIGLCLLDKRVKCKRCGVSIHEGLCN
ncbi:hypothetical protein QCA50_004388 [Cerrena zonata]|uniref:Brain protein I3 n=1 Tax=Cerrena zonata TaxID=2478898 RepID=A0AAW0GTU7_9APHY